MAVLLLTAPGVLVARAGGVRGPMAAVAVAPVLTYGIVALAIVPFGAVGIPWNAESAAAVLTAVSGALYRIPGFAEAAPEGTRSGGFARLDPRSPPQQRCCSGPC